MKRLMAALSLVGTISGANAQQLSPDEFRAAFDTFTLICAIEKYCTKAERTPFDRHLVSRKYVLADSLDNMRCVWQGDVLRYEPVLKDIQRFAAQLERDGQPTCLDSALKP